MFQGNNTSELWLTCDAEANPELAQQLGFEKVKEQLIEEYKSSGVLYKHKKNGSRSDVSFK